MEGFLINHPPNLSYLFNIRPSIGFALCSVEESVLILDSRYIEQAESDAVTKILALRQYTEQLRRKRSGASTGAPGLPETEE